MLDPGVCEPGATLFDFPDLFREIANALRCQHCYREALAFYKPLQSVNDHLDTALFMDTALCYRALGEHALAEDCYNTILEYDSSFTEARIALWNMEREPRDPKTLADVNSTSAQSLFDQDSISLNHATASPHRKRPNRAMLSSAPPTSATGRCRSLSRSSHRDTEIQALFVRWRQSKGIRFEAAKLLLQTFSDERVFYPAERQMRFYGYSREARALTRRKLGENLSMESDTIVGEYCVHSNS